MSSRAMEDLIARAGLMRGLLTGMGLAARPDSEVAPSSVEGSLAPEEVYPLEKPLATAPNTRYGRIRPMRRRRGAGGVAMSSAIPFVKPALPPPGGRR